jgi:site-specific recombinase XerD
MAAFRGRYKMRDRALFLLGIKSGFRISELLAIKVRDVWNGTGVRASVTVAAAWMKGRKNSRTMPINPAAAEAIRLWLRVSGMDHAYFADWPLFHAQGHKKAITSRQAFSILVESVIDAGIDPARVGTHSLRKSFASAAWSHPSVNKDMAKMAKLLGHRNFSNTLRYLEFMDDSLTTAVMEI